MRAASIEISPKRPTSATWPGMTKVVDSASRMTAGPWTTAPDRQRARARTRRRCSGSAARWRSSIVRAAPAPASPAPLARDVLDLVGGDDELHAIGDALDRHVREAVAVAPLVGLVEALDQRGHRLGA